MNKNFLSIIKKLKVTLFIIASFFLPTSLLYAACPQGGTNTSSGPFGIVIQNPLLGACDIYDFIKLLVNNVILPVGGSVAVVFIIYSGFLFVTAQGNETKLATAKKAFLYSVIGTAILLGAWVLSEGVAATIKTITG
jgi:hypothetical protein